VVCALKTGIAVFLQFDLAVLGLLRPVSGKSTGFLHLEIAVRNETGW